MNEKQTVVVTGITGFLGSHIAIQLLDKGYAVRGTMRDLGRAEAMRQVIGAHARSTEFLDFAQAELTDETAWGAATQGADYVMHVASPFPQKLPKHEDELIKPACDGVLNVLRASAANGVRRIVVTSSSGAIVYGRDKNQRSRRYDESDWTNLDNRTDTTPYFRSKTLAEQAAWDFIKADDSGMELATVCPGAILGPVLEKDFGNSANIVIKTMDGSSPAIPRMGFEIVDVRSVADLHIRAMENPAAAGERFIGAEGFLWFREVADILREKYPDRKIPRLTLPHWCVCLFSFVEPTLKPILNDLGAHRTLDHSKAERLLGWRPKPAREAVLSCAESVIGLGLA